MGKNKHLKKLRKLAETLPELARKGIAYEIVEASTLMKEGVRQIDGKPVTPQEKYRRPIPQPVNFNHSRNLKKAYQKGGQAEVYGYLKGVEHYVKDLKAKNEQQAQQQKDIAVEGDGMAEQADRPAQDL